MAKELPYFKFEPNQWENGNIQMCSKENKGLFIDLCSVYWSRLGELPYALALQKHCNGSNVALKELESNEIIVVKDSQIIIEFLDEQLNEFQETSKKRRSAANKRWSNSSALQVQSKSNAIREDKKIEEKKKEYNIEARKLTFKESLFDYVGDYKKETVKAFFEYWSEHGDKDKKMRFEKEKSFGVKRRLSTWAKNDFDKTENPIEEKGKGKGGVSMEELYNS